MTPDRRGGDDFSVIRNFALNVTDNNTATLQNRLIPIEYHRFFKANRRLNKAYLLKEMFSQLWDYKREVWARRFFARLSGVN